MQQRSGKSSKCILEPAIIIFVPFGIKLIYVLGLLPNLQQYNCLTLRCLMCRKTDTRNPQQLAASCTWQYKYTYKNKHLSGQYHIFLIAIGKTEQINLYIKHNTFALADKTWNWSTYHIASTQCYYISKGIQKQIGAYSATAKRE